MQNGVSIGVNPLIKSDGVGVAGIHQKNDDVRGTGENLNVREGPVTSSKEAHGSGAARDPGTIILGGPATTNSNQAKFHEVVVSALSTPPVATGATPIKRFSPGESQSGLYELFSKALRRVVLHCRFIRLRR